MPGGKGYTAVASSTGNPLDRKTPTDEGYPDARHSPPEMTAVKGVVGAWKPLARCCLRFGMWKVEIEERAAGMGPKRSMMTSRQRMEAAFDFTVPDKIPVVYHPSPAGLRVHGRRLLDLFKRYPPDNPISFESLPTLPPDSVGADGRYHEIRTDAWGTELEYLIYGLHGIPRRFPFPDWEAGADYEFPPLPAIGAAQRDAVAEQRREYLVFGGGISIFERLHCLRPMADVLVDLYSEDAHLLAFLDRLVAYWLEMIDRLLTAGVDVISFGDDWGTQDAPLVSPALFRRVFRPRYERLMAPIQAAGKRVFFHCCGCMGEILDELFDLGIHGLWPQLPLYENDAAFILRCRENGVAIYIHPDRQHLIPLGAPAEIRARIRGYAETYRALGGGGIFYIEIENDAPFENVRALIEAVHTYR